MENEVETHATAIGLIKCPSCESEMWSVPIENGRSKCHQCGADLGKDPPTVTREVDAVYCDLCQLEITLTPENIVSGPPDFIQAVGCPRCNDAPQSNMYSIHIIAVEQDGRWVAPDALLRQEDATDGIHGAGDMDERRALWHLNCLAQLEPPEFKSIQEDTEALLLWKDGETIGYLSFTGSSHPTFDQPCMHQIFVRQPFRRRGFGTELVESFLNLFPGEVLGESPNEVAAKLFEKMGLVAVDEEGGVEYKERLKFVRSPF